MSSTPQNGPPYSTILSALGMGKMPFLGRDSIELAQNTLIPNEQILYAIWQRIAVREVTGAAKASTGRLTNEETEHSVFCVTNLRVFNASQLFFTGGVTIMPYANIVAVDVTLDGARSLLRVRTLKEEILMQGIDHELVRIKTLINGAMLMPSAPAAQPQVVTQETSRDRTTALKDLKELLDSGILSQEEFDVEKARILQSAPQESHGIAQPIPNPPPAEPISVTLNGTALTFNAPPIIADGRTLVPMRTIFEALGAAVSWDGATKTITVAKGDTTIVLPLDSTTPTINGQTVTIDAPATSINGTTYVSIRFVAESFGVHVAWDGNTRTVAISDGPAAEETSIADLERPNTAEESTDKPDDDELTGNPEVDAFVAEGHALINALDIAKRKLKNKSIAAKSDEIIEVSKNIIDKIRRNPQLISSVRRFLNYYLPTANKLVTNYNYMENQGVEGGNIFETMQKIDDSLDTLLSACKKQLDNLFSHTAMDISADIDVLETVLKQEGLIDDGFPKIT